MVDHERIWLEPEPGADEEYGRQWCQHNVWGDEATEYVRADLEAALASPAEPMAPIAWYRDKGFVQNFHLASDKPANNTSDPYEWKPLYAHPPQQEPARLREALESIAHDKLTDETWPEQYWRVVGIAQDAIRTLSQKKEG